ncbi:MAG: hypothetical protein ACK5H1_09265 [Tenacibaculum sp.]
MASIKNLKKDINYILGDIVEDCYNWQVLNPKANFADSEAIIDDAISIFDNLLNKINSKNIDNKKSHYKAIRRELKNNIKSLSIRIDNLHS